MRQDNSPVTEGVRGTLHQSADSAYQNRNGQAIAAWARSAAGEYHENINSERNTVPYVTPEGYLGNTNDQQGMQLPTTGQVGGHAMKYEWHTPEMVPAVASHHPGQAHSHFGQVPSYSHSVHSSQGMDGMEYGRPGAPPHYAPHQQTQRSAQQYQQPQGIGDTNAYPVFDHHTRAPDQMAHYQTYSGGLPPGANGAGVPYAPAPRELAEMGLASQSSGLNQRWTSFMHDSGLFYSSDGST